MQKRRKSRSTQTPQDEKAAEVKAALADTDAILADIDRALEGLDENLAVNYRQLGGE